MRTANWTGDTKCVPSPSNGTDPVLARVELWRHADERRIEAQAALCDVESAVFAKPDRSNEDRAAIENVHQHHGRAFDVHWDALRRVYATAPTSLAGAIALLDTMLVSDDGTCSHPEIPTAVANVVTLLRSL